MNKTILGLVLLAMPALAGGAAPSAAITVEFDLTGLSGAWYLDGSQPIPQPSKVTLLLDANQTSKTYLVGGRYPENTFQLVNSSGRLTVSSKNQDLLVLKPCAQRVNCWDVKPNLLPVPLVVDEPQTSVTVDLAPVQRPLQLAKGMLAIVSVGDRQSCIFNVADTPRVTLRSGMEACEGGPSLRVRAQLPEPLRVYSGEPGTVRWQGKSAYSSGIATQTQSGLRMVGLAYDFLSRGDSWDVQADLAISLPKDGAISMWVNPAAAGAFLGNARPAVLTPSLFVGDKCFGYRVGHEDVESPQVPPVVDDCAKSVFGAWHHVVLAWKSTRSQSTSSTTYDIDFFVDGCARTSTHLVGELARARTNLGSLQDAKFIGQIDQVELFERALTPAMVKELCRHGEPGACRCTPQ